LQETCSALQGQGKRIDPSIGTGFKWLINTILKSYEKRQERVDTDTREQQEREAQEKRGRAERVRKIREER